MWVQDGPYQVALLFVSLEDLKAEIEAEIDEKFAANSRSSATEKA